MVLTVINDLKKRLSLGQSECAVDRRSFTNLYQQNKVSLLRYVMTIVFDQQVAEEIVQEAFLRLYRQRVEIENLAHAKSWLYTVARNLSFDYLKKKKEVLYHLSDDDQSDAVPWENIEDAESAVEVQLIAQAEKMQVQKLFEKLPVTQREALSLWLDELSYTEMEKVTGKSIQSLKNLVHRARQTLANELRRLEEE